MSRFRRTSRSTTTCRCTLTGRIYTLLVLCAIAFALSVIHRKLDVVFDGSSILNVVFPVPPKILVVYSGPTAIINVTNDAPILTELYMKNFEYFVRRGRGVDCTNHDTVLVVADDAYQYYQNEIQQQQLQCSSKSTTTNHFVKFVRRENICYDMESVRLVMYGLVPGVNISHYDYFIFINCGTTGPALRDRSEPHWTQEFIKRFDDSVRMVGLSHNCFPKGQGNHVRYRPHIQSMVYALDRKGIELVLDSGAVYDCRKGGGGKASVIFRYEVDMSRYIQNQGYAVRSILRNTTLRNFSATTCEGLDMWMTFRLREAYGGRIPSINETLFFKTSRILTPEIAELINYTKPVTWNWGD